MVSLTRTIPTSVRRKHDHSRSGNCLQSNGTNNKIALPFGTSLYDLKQSQALLASKLIVREGLRVFVPAAALVQVSESFFKQNPIEIRVTLESTRDASEVLQHLLEGGHSTVAGRLGGAFRHINRPDIADEIIKTMKVAGYDVRESNPFGRERAFEVAPSTSPIVGRMQALWEVAREAVIEVFHRHQVCPRTRMLICNP